MSFGLDAFGAVNFDWTSHLQSVWREPSFDVEEVHKPVADELIDYFVKATHDPGLSPLGRVVVGPAGAGKTHLIGRLRRRAWQVGGWFVLIDTVGIKDFWPTVALGYLTSLQQPVPDGRPQYEAVLSEMLRCFVRDAGAREAFLRWHSPQRTRFETISHFISLLRRIDPVGVFRHGDVVRALLLLGVEDWEVANLAYGWLQGLDVDPDRRRQLGFLGPPPEASRIVRGLSWLMGMGGPTLIAVDQIDAIVSASNLRGNAGEPLDEEESKARSIIEILAGGLMDLRDVTTRSVTLVTCLEATWQVLSERSVRSATQRFREVTPLEGIAAAELVEALVAARLAPAYASHHFTPPYPTWPFRAEAIEGAIGLLPRPILMRCEEHRRRCLAAGEVLECTSLNEATRAAPQPPAADLDALYCQELAEADISAFQRDQADDTAFRELLGEALSLYVRQIDIPDDVDVEVEADPDQRRPSLHGRLTFIFRGEGDRELHFCFRALGHSNAMAFQARLRAAITASGIDRALEFRRLFVLRRDPAPGGAGSRTAQLVSEFESLGGKFIASTDEDLRILVALRRLRQRSPETFETWLRRRKPLCDTLLFKEAGLCPPVFLADKQPKPVPDLRPEPEAPSPAAPAILLGTEGGETLSLPLDLLARHVAIFAGTGSGRTVLLRRLIEEAALAGVATLVVDSGDELAQLGDDWPSPPQWSEVDAAKAAVFRERVEVKIISPGQPLAVPPLPDFSRFDDPDEREQAIETTCLALRPFVSAAGPGGSLEQSVLADALRFLALRRAGSLEELAGLLEDLPVGTSQISQAPAFAAEMAEHLRAAMAGHAWTEAESFDPSTLFTAEETGKTRISVVSLSGLHSEEARQRYVDRLQLALLTWIGRLPEAKPLLYVLDEAQNFVPAQTKVACGESALALAAEAGGQGLGLVLATASPKSLDTRIASRCATQFYGKMHAPAAIRATNDLLAGKGLAGGDVARLAAGDFYVSSPVTDTPVKIRAPFCLSWHRAHHTSPGGAADTNAFPPAASARRAYSRAHEDTEANM